MNESREELLSTKKEDCKNGTFRSHKFTSCNTSRIASHRDQEKQGIADQTT